MQQGIHRSMRVVMQIWLCPRGNFGLCGIQVYNHHHHHHRIILDLCRVSKVACRVSFKEEKMTYSAFFLVAVSRGYHAIVYPNNREIPRLALRVRRCNRRLRVFAHPPFSIIPEPQYSTLCLLSNPYNISPHQVCFVVPSTSPCTFPQSILLSISSSTRPTTATLSPRMM